MIATSKYRSQMAKMLRHLETQLKDEQQRGVVSRDVVFREYANGRVLLREDWTENVLQSYGPNGRIDIALDRIIREVKDILGPFTPGVSVALTRNLAENQYFLVLVNVKPLR